MSKPRLNPGPWQVKSWYAALTALSLVVLASVATGALGLIVRAADFLQPLLIPLVAAVILAYLLMPVVNWLCARGVKRTWAVLLLFLAIVLGFSSIGFWIGPLIWQQTVQFMQTIPDQAARGQKLLLSTLNWFRDLEQSLHPAIVPVDERTLRDELWALAGTYVQDIVQWIQQKLPEILGAGGVFLQRSVGGFLGVAGIVLSMVLVPLFLFFFLRDAGKLEKDWRRYIPLPDSPLKDEAASLLEEINTYLVRYFRGQFIVSLIDGLLIGIALFILGLNFSLLIGLGVALLALIPYVGLTICWLPAVLISIAQFGDWWHPLMVTIIFVGMSNLESFFIAPRVVGGSVSLHPLTVILSVLIWSLILGVLLGALLAVPLTATLKVLLQRYVWHRSN